MCDNLKDIADDLVAVSRLNRKILNELSDSIVCVKKAGYDSKELINCYDVMIDAQNSVAVARRLIASLRKSCMQCEREEGGCDE